jgi:cysteine synthase A
MVYAKPYEIIGERHFLELPELLPGCRTCLKLEGINPAGSIKLKAAVAMVDDAEASGHLRPGGHIIESSSGSLGVALAMIAAARGYSFSCVVDPNITASSTAAIRAFGGQVIRVDRADKGGGYLGARLDAVRARVAVDATLVWLNQYTNPANPAAHAAGTAASILAEFPVVDYLFVGVGTAGTLMGCLDHLRRHSPRTRVVAVDAEGSVTFGTAPAPRRLPGLGSSRRPPLFEPGRAYRQVQIGERDAIGACRMLARRYGYLAGGSTGSTVAAIQSMRTDIAAGSVVIALSPDSGERYLNTVYDDDWVRACYGADALTSGPTGSAAPSGTDIFDGARL